MMVSTKYRKILKHHKLKVDKNVDALVHVDYILFLQRIAEKSSKLAAEQGSKKVDENHIEEIFEIVLKEFRA